MLNYEDFKAVVKDQILSYAPKEYRSAKVVIKTVKKVNILRDALWLQTKDMTAAPIVYLDTLYKKYKEFQDFSKTMYFAIEWMFGSTTASDLNVDEFLKDIEDKIIFSVVGTQQNESLLKLLVHKDFLDMSLIYSVLNIQIVDDKPLLYTAKITNAMADHYHLTPEDLYRLAYKNTMRLLPPKVMSVRELLQDDFSCILPVAFAKDMDSMFVISNIYESNGAVALAYEDELYELAQRMNSNLYIIPSSIHEIIVIPEDMVDLKGCIPYINAIQPSKEDKLTSHIYFYDKKTRTLSIFNREK